MHFVGAFGVCYFCIVGIFTVGMCIDDWNVGLLCGGFFLAGSLSLEL